MAAGEHAMRIWSITSFWPTMTWPDLSEDVVAHGLKAIDALFQFRGIRIKLCDGGHFYFPSLESFNCNSNFCAGR